MKKKTSLELTSEQMRNLAEMAAFVMVMMDRVRGEDMDERKLLPWLELVRVIMEHAATCPELRKNMEVHPELQHWFFSQKYSDSAFFNELFDEARDAIFWDELVSRMADHVLVDSLSPDEVEQLDPQEREERVEALEKAFWAEVSEHGIERLAFIVAPDES